MENESTKKDWYAIIKEFALADPIMNAPLLAAIERLTSKEPIVLKDVCEACGQPTVDFAIHDECKEWWC